MSEGKKDDEAAEPAAAPAADAAAPDAAPDAAPAAGAAEEAAAPAETKDKDAEEPAAEVAVEAAKDAGVVFTKNVLQWLSKAFGGLDADKSGALTEEELFLASRPVMILQSTFVD